MSNNAKLSITVVLVALALRGVFCYMNIDRFSADPDAYARIAETISETGVYGLTSREGNPVPTAFRPPLYPFSLSWLVNGGKLSRIGVAITHAILGAITALLVFLIMKEMFGVGATKAGLIAAFLATIDPVLVQQSTQVMTETLATVLATAVIWWWARCCRDDLMGFRSSIGSVVLLGVLLALAYLCRPTFFAWAVLLSAVALLIPMATWSRRLGLSALILLPLVLAVFAWTARNQRVMGHPIWATTHGGYTLLLGNNPLFYQYLRDGSFGEAWDASSFLSAYIHRHNGDPKTEQFWRSDWSTVPVRPTGQESAVTEYEDDRICYNAARATIGREPAMFVWSCFVRLGRLWSPFPHLTTDRSSTQVAIVGVYYVGLYLAIALGLWRAGRTVFTSRWWPIWMLAITLSVVHAIYWSNLRMRAPIIPALAVVAAASLAPRQNQADVG